MCGQALFTDGSIAQIYNGLTGHWSATPIDLTGDFRTVGGKLLIGPSNIYNARQDQIAILTPSAITPPATPSPIPGGTLDRSAYLSWSAVEGATGYDVYLDETLIANVSTTHWTPATAIIPGAHTWRTTAKIGAASLAGPLWNFSI